LGFQDNVLDGRIDPVDRNFTLKRFAKFHHVAQFANTHPSLKEKHNNVKYVCFNENHQPYFQAPYLHLRCFLVAKRDIEAGEELFAWCGKDLASEIREMEA
jgi:hypothetical protein